MKNIYKVFVGFLVLMFITGIGMSFAKLVLIWVVFIPRFVIGVYPTLIKDFINKEIVESRSTILSFRAFSKQIPSILLMPIIGKTIDLYGLEVMFIIYAIIAALSTLLIISLLKKNKLDAKVEVNNQFDRRIV